MKISNNLKPLFFITFVLSCFLFFNHQEKPSLEKAQIKTTTKNDNKELIKSINMLREDIFNLKEELEILKEDHKSFVLNKKYETNVDIPLAQSLNNFDPYVKNDSAKSIQIKTTTTKNPSYNESKKEALESLMATDIFENIPDTI